MEVMLVDDEILAINLLERYLKEHADVTIVARFTDTKKALEYLNDHKLDLIFLDIEMPGMSGLELVHKILEVDLYVNVIFVTAFAQYAVEAFEVNALDYLLKPLDRERLEKALNRIRLKTRVDVKMHHEKVDIQGMFIKSFGEFNLYNSNCSTETIKFRTAKAKELLAFLNEHMDEQVHKEKVLAMLFEDEDMERANCKLHLATYYLRKNLIDHGYQDALTFKNGYYLLPNHGITSDAKALKLAYWSWKHSSGKLIEELEKIVDIYRGNYLLGSNYSWARTYELWYEQIAIEAAYELVLHYAKIGYFERTLFYGQWIIEKDPYHEKAYYYVAIAYIELRNKSKALQTYKCLCKTLKTDLGIYPDKDLVKEIEYRLK